MQKLPIKPFSVPGELDSFLDTYPTIGDIVTLIKSGNQDARYALARLWLSEGIPYCFKDKPAIFESLRLWIARELDIQAKEITIIGSGRQGFSLSPGETLGRPFGEHSDLDLTIVSLPLFKALKENFEQWRKDYVSQEVLPRNAREAGFWAENVKILPGTVSRGFIDPYKIPTLNRYLTVRTVIDTQYVVREKLQVTPGAPKVKDVSIRVYQDWDSFIGQLTRNLAAIG